MSKNEIDLESLRDLLWEIDNQVVTHGIGYREVITRTERVVSEVIAELAARRARDAEVEALVAACRLARSYMSEAIEYETPCAKRDGANVDAALLPFTGAKP